MPARTILEKEIFVEALELPTPEERLGYVRRSCGADQELQERVEALLKANTSAGGFLANRRAPAKETRTASTQGEFMEAAGLVIGRYTLHQRLGEGGFGAVWLAEQKEPVRRRVALKIIKLGMQSKQVVARFEAERQALALMDHSNIAKVLDAGTTDSGRPYFVMELVRGIKITEYCDQNKLSVRERLHLFVQVCDAIQHAHQKGIIHRDIKPSNILVRVQDGLAVPKVIDFGIAKVTDRRLSEDTIFTDFAQFLGTPAYVSPEQAEMGGVDIDTRSDIYSLGVLLYELLTGKTPFDAKELLKVGFDEMRRTIREQEPLAPSKRLSLMLGGELAALAQRRQTEPGKLIHQLRGDLDWIVARCLEKDRGRRYDTANGLAKDIQRHLQHEPVAAGPPSRVYRFQKLVKRNKLTVALSSAIVLVLFGGAIISAWQAILAKRAQQEAVSAQVAEREQRLLAQQKQRAAETSDQKSRHHLYTANMNLAQQAWEQGNIGQTRQLLEETSTDPERGFEWYYWQRRTHREARTLSGHSGRIRAVALSADAQRVVTGSEDETAKVWDAATGKELVTLKGHRGTIFSVAFSRDGQHVLTGARDQTARVWDAASGKELLVLKGYSGQIWPLSFSPDGRRIATGSQDHTAKVWDVPGGQEMLLLKGHSGQISAVAFSPDGQWIVTGSEDQTAGVWDASSGHHLRSLDGHGGGIRSLAFSPDSQRIATASADQNVKVWDAASGEELLTLNGYVGSIESVTFSEDGQRILTGGADQMVKIWDALTGKLLHTLKGHDGLIRCVAFSPDGQRIATGNEDGTGRVWDPENAKEILALKGHTHWVTAVCFSEEGQRLITAGYDQTSRVWDVVTGKELASFQGHKGSLLSLAVSPDGRWIVTGNEDGTATVLDVATGKELRSLNDHRATIFSVAYSSDGRRIVTGSGDETAKVWDAATGQELLSLKGHHGMVRSAMFSADGQRIVTGSWDETAKVWDATDGKDLLTLRGHHGQIWSAAFSADGRRVVTGSSDQVAKVWDAMTGRELLTLKGHSSIIRSAAFSPDGQRVVTGSWDQTAKLWDAMSGKELLTLKGHTAPIVCLAFSPDGLRIATGSLDQTVNVWVASTPQEVGAWQAEEQASTERRAFLQHEQQAKAERERLRRVQDPGAIKRWLVLGPIPFTGAADAVGLDNEQIPDEGQLRPTVGEAVRVAGSERVWRAAELEDYQVNFNGVLGGLAPSSVAYAVCYIESDISRSGLQVSVRSDDEAKLYLNGNQIYEYRQPRSYLHHDIVEGLELKAGLNVLVFKVVNESEDWEGSVRFADKDGNPVQGIRVTLVPGRARSR